MNNKHSLVISVLFFFAILLGACAPAVAMPGNPTYDESLTPVNGSVIGERRPTISWTVYPNGQNIDTFRMQLNGRDVAAEKTARGASVVFSYKPLNELPPGNHTVSMSISFDGYQPLTLVSRFTIVSNPVNPFEGKDGVQLASMETEAVNYLNTIRKILGLSVLSVHQSLTAAAQSHSNFLQLNHFIGHYQGKEYPGFTGVAPQDRAVFFGYSGSATEGIDYGTSSPRISIEGLMDAPYHRLGLINPNDREVGVGFSLQPYTMVINTGNPGSRDNDRVMVYPYPGQQDAKSAWFVAESPNPLASYGKDKIYVGYPISLSLHDAKTKEIQLISAALKDSAGHDVPHYIVDSRRESEFRKHVFLIPQQPLKPGTTYHVRIEGNRILVDGSSRPVAEAWSFTTRNAIAIDYLGLVNLDGVDNLELKLKNGDIQDLSYILIQNGEFIRKYTTKQGFSWTNASPITSGKYRLQVAAPSLMKELIEYVIEIQVDNGKMTVAIVGQTSLGTTPPVYAGLLRLGGREYIELFWQHGKPSNVSYVLKRGGETVRSYKDDRYYAPRGLSLADGDYLLEISLGSTAPQQFILSLYTMNGERRVSLTPVR